MATLGNNRQVVEEGNTGTSSTTQKQKQTTRKTFYALTFYEYEDKIDAIQKRMQEIGKKGIYGYETCPTTNKKHLQGFIALKKPMRITELKLPCNPHCEPCIASEEANTRYCKKDGNYWSFGFPKPLKLITPDKDWQIKILNIIAEEPDDRKVYWFWSQEGGIGKSQFCKYLLAQNKCVFIDEGKKADIMFCMMESNMDEKNVVIFDVPRDNGNSVSYKSIESIKNGMIFSPKYESGYKLFNSPHVIVFANQPPITEKLSSDRWIIEEIF